MNRKYHLYQLFIAILMEFYFVITFAIIYAICLQFNMDIIGAIGWALEKTWSFIVQLAMKIKELEVFQKMFQ